MLENENVIDLLGSLKVMSSEQLSRLIQEETEKEAPNDELVLMALDILEDRGRENPIELGPKGKTAWKKYQKKVCTRDRKTVLIWKPLMQVASVVLVITVLFALLPTQANAETWWERLARWTDDFFSFFNPNTSEVPEEEYIFQTDNEGLQQVYDALTQWEITDPAVPMRIPEGYILSELIVDELPDQKVLRAAFRCGKEKLVFHYSLVNVEIPYQFYKDETNVITYEKQGVVYNIVNNINNYVVIWSIDKLECAFSVDCQEDVLYEIIESIYRRRSFE